MIDSLLRLLRILWEWMVSFWQSRFGPVLTMDDSGMKVRVGSKIAEGGFSVVFHATDLGSLQGTPSLANPRHQKYVLKRIRCHDGETRSGCLRESKVHYAIMRQQQQSQQQHSPSILAAGGGSRGGRIASTAEETIRESLSGNIMPLLGMTFCEGNTICYMLFPYLSNSLKREIDRRIFEPMEEATGNTINKNGSFMSETKKRQKIKDALRMPPWSETTVLRWFEQLCDAVLLMHEAGFTHRDIKIDNLLLHPGDPTTMSGPISSSNIYRSGGDASSGVVLMDYGSAGPLTRSLETRKDVLEIADEASTHTTISYRPPELFAGELRVAAPSRSAHSKAGGETAVDPELVLDYRKVDSWMLGCTLFAILFGVSPGECEFSRSTGQLLIVDPTHNKMLGQMPPWPTDETPPARWYSTDVRELLGWILQKDRGERPFVIEIRGRVRELLSQKPSLFAGERNGGMDVENQGMI